MKKTLSLILITTLAVTSLVGAAAVVSKKLTTADTNATTTSIVASSTEATKKIEPTKATTKATEASTAPTAKPANTTKSTATNKTSKASTTSAKIEVSETSVAPKQTNENTLILPDVTGTWKHVDDNGCSIQVVKQEGNKLYLTIESHNENYSKIATSRLVLTLRTFADNEGTFGTAYFNYADSFGSGGRGTIIVYEDRIELEIKKEFDPNTDWNITSATGVYYFDSENINPNELNRFDNLPENQQIFDISVYDE
ncbi:MAG: hypothetical protein IKB73_05265 [Ruminococcus sp.]|nr:hypothetical protein [Ruminococcus sp.]